MAAADRGGALNNQREPRERTHHPSQAPNPGVQGQYVPWWGRRGEAWEAGNHGENQWPALGALGARRCDDVVLGRTSSGDVLDLSEIIFTDI